MNPSTAAAADSDFDNRLRQIAEACRRQAKIADVQSARMRDLAHEVDEMLCDRQEARRARREKAAAAAERLPSDEVAPDGRKLTEGEAWAKVDREIDRSNEAA